MKIIGLVGGTGAGKGTVSRMLEKYNFAAIDTDAVYHEITSSMTPCLLKLRENFGDGIITPNGSLDRRALAGIVFKEGAENKRALLNSIAHKFVLDEVRERISALKEQGYTAVLVDAPLLFESGFDKECDSILCITAGKNVRMQRIIERDSISIEMASSRIRAQLTDEELKKRSDFVIENDGDLDALSACVEKTVPMILN